MAVEQQFLDIFNVRHIFTFRPFSGVEVLEKVGQLQISLERRFFTPTTAKDGEKLELFDKNVVDVDTGVDVVVDVLLFELVKRRESAE